MWRDVVVLSTRGPPAAIGATKRVQVAMSSR